MVKPHKQSMKAAWVGVDPGQNGALACIGYTPDKPIRVVGRVVYVLPFSKLTERDIFESITTLVCGARDNDLEVIGVLELVHSMPKQGVSSMFKFGYNFGLLEMCLIATGVGYTKVTPQKWQKTLGCNRRKGEGKNATKRRAQQLFPRIKVTHDIADALLLAEYCRLLYG